MFMEVFGRKTNFIIPVDGPAVEGEVLEILRILEFYEDSLIIKQREIKQAHVPIAECELQQVAGDILGGD